MRLLIATLLATLSLTSATFAAPQAKSVQKKKYSIAREYKIVIRKAHRDFDRCPQAESLRTKKRVKGVVLIRYIVNGDGKVTDSGIIHNTTKSRAVADCVLRTLERLKFPASFGAPTKNTYPFKFNFKK